MKFCTHCGSQIPHEDSVICVNCGRSIAPATPAVKKQSDDTMATVIKVFLILGCIAQGWMILPLAWCLPITISACNAMKEKRPMGTGLKVCALLFVNMIAGICMLCMNDDN